MVVQTGEYLGDSSDDPSLDLDDIDGLGPENINIYNPQANGTYTVFVHDYTGSAPSDTLGPNNVTINVYLNGTQAWSGTKAISDDGSVTPFCEINSGNFIGHPFVTITSASP